MDLEGSVVLPLFFCTMDPSWTKTTEPLHLYDEPMGLDGGLHGMA